MKKLLAVLLAALLLSACVPAMAAPGTPYLIGFVHNCPNTGKMLPATFDPYTNTILLTVADWVTTVNFTLTSTEGQIYVNEVYVPNGGTCKDITMTNDPQEVYIRLVNGSEQNLYVVYLQRRPSEKRNRVSSGWIREIYQRSNSWYISADLVNIEYQSKNYTNGTVYKYNDGSSSLFKYVASTHCAFYYLQNGYLTEANDIYEFMSHYSPSSMYRIIYVENEVVAVMPWDPIY